MKVNLLFLLFISLAIAGCQKEPSVELPGGGTDEPSSGRLARMVYQYSPTDSAYTEFSYDGAGRWTGLRTIGDDAAVLTESSEIRVTRNGSGIITNYAVKEDDGTGSLSTSTYVVHYDAAAKRYTSRVSTFERNGSMLVDSTIFVINNGRMATQRFVYKERASGLFLEVGRLEFAYDAVGNPVRIDTYESDGIGSTAKKSAEVALQYDAKTAALNLGVEALVLNQFFFASPNNITRVSYKDLSNPATPSENLISIAYQYHSSNKPKSAEISVDGGKIPLLFRYQ